jgi:hypothetical protein
VGTHELLGIDERALACVHIVGVPASADTTAALRVRLRSSARFVGEP